MKIPKNKNMKDLKNVRDFTNIAQLDNVARTIGGDLPLLGTLSWDRGSEGWLAGWRLRSGDRTYRWQIRDVNFDDAFRSAMRGTAQILSGNGAPR